MQIKEILNTHIPFESRILLSYVTGFSLEYLIGHSDKILSAGHISKFQELVSRRKKGEPIAYIIGKKEFYSRDFVVTPDVLIPRPDSETLIDAVLHDISIANSNSPLQILELGIGSGCLLLTLLSEMPFASGVGIDISHKALEVAKKNAALLGVESKAKLMISNWFDNVTDKFDIIISNPPYIYEEEKFIMAQETLEYEPHLALFGGLSPYYIIASEAHKFLQKNGRIYVEIGVNQMIDVENLFLDKGYIVIEKHHDIEERVRVIAFALDRIE